MSGDYSIYTGQKKTFTIPDYVLFSLTLAISAGIGLFYAIKDRNKVNSKDYLLGGKDMNILPVAMSLLVTFLSALTLLGTPAEMYNFSTMFWWLCLAFVFAMVISSVVFIPFFYNLNVTSVFQYLELRFSKPVRVLASLIYILQTSAYMSFVLYAPSLALNAVTGLDLWGSLIAVGIIVTLYTALGGMKAVLWTDTFQAFVILAGLLAVLIQGSIVMGGFQNAWDIAGNRSRIYFHDFSFDPTTRHSFWSIVVGGAFFWTSLYGVNQAQVQRTMSCPSISKARLTLLVNLPGLILIVSLCCMIGIVMYAFYADCHPIKFNNLISKTDQLLPLYVMDILGHIPGIPGVFVSCIFSGSLSTLSSSLNALGAVIPCDLIKPYFCPNLSDRSMTILSKVIVVIFGGVAIGLAVLVSQLGSVLQASYSVYSVINGPLFGLFILGMFFPWANAWGAFVGAVTSLAFMCWIGFGAFANKVSTAKPSPVFTHGCNWSVTTTAMTVTTTLGTATPFTGSTEMTTVAASSDPFIPMYKLSYLFYTPTAMAVLVIVGMFVSLITGLRRPDSIDPRLICPLFDRLFPCMPEMILRPLRCGVNHNGKYRKQAYEQADELPEKIQPADVNGVETKSSPDVEVGAINPGFDPVDEETSTPEEFVTHL
ncbi:sodium-coupled monocarboxylate transporter 1-like isoform X1 [Haliotis rubra]|uniref:sodium-coupled monocarboxylate transporter 1-like isoform X1 n=1 Tax=Haliotis rubra TaxID=36100 RepID=UPI001EE55623|nr:sodium-coupled monocarboxylate transporter 1-like isoform X1 [Haliotis rubra]